MNDVPVNNRPPQWVWALLVAVGAVVAAVAATTEFAPEPAPPSVLITTDTASEAPAASLPATTSLPAGALRLDKLTRRIDPDEAPDLFAAKSWYTPPPPPPPSLVQVEKPKPVAPPLPFTFIGNIEDKGEMMVFLGMGADVLKVRVGETFARDYRLESVAAESATVTYLPLKETQTVSAAR